MSGEFDAIGTAIEGALVSAAVEGEAGAAVGDDGKTHESDCLNCGSTLTGPFCNQCGQHAHVHRSLAAIWHDVLHGVLHFDGKIWRTLPMLAFKPGDLTRRYIRGERASFISPMALFLLSIFLMFAIFSFSGGPAVSDTDTPETIQQLNTEIRQQEQKIGILELQVRNGTGSREELLEAREGLTEFKQALNLVAKLAGKPIPYPDVGLNDDMDDRIVNYDSDAKTGIKWLDDRIESGAKKANANPTLLLYKLKSNGYKFAWLLIPLSLPFVWLVTLGAGGSLRAHHLYDHAIFTTYSIAFMSLLFLIATMIANAGYPAAYLALVIIPPLHLYKQLRHSYQLSRISTLLRLILLLASIGVIMVMFISILVLLGILG